MPILNAFRAPAPARNSANGQRLRLCGGHLLTHWPEHFQSEIARAVCVFFRPARRMPITRHWTLRPKGPMNTHLYQWGLPRRELWLIRKSNVRKNWTVAVIAAQSASSSACVKPRPLPRRNCFWITGCRKTFFFVLRGQGKDRVRRFRRVAGTFLTALAVRKAPSLCGCRAAERQTDAPVFSGPRGLPGAAPMQPSCNVGKLRLAGTAPGGLFACAMPRGMSACSCSVACGPCRFVRRAAALPQWRGRVFSQALSAG